MHCHNRAWQGCDCRPLLRQHVDPAHSAYNRGLETRRWAGAQRLEVPDTGRSLARHADQMPVPVVLQNLVVILGVLIGADVIGQCDAPPFVYDRWRWRNVIAHP